MSKKLTLYTDGGARGNPGPAGAGFVLYEGKKKIAERGVYLGVATNNQAEYIAVYEGLKCARESGASEVVVRTDSELVARQLNREYRVKDAGLGRLFVKIWNVLPAFQKVSFVHIGREKNNQADVLVNRAIDDGMVGLQEPLTKI